MKSIGVFLGVGIAGMFVGAVTMEIIHRVRPNLFKELGESTKKTFGTIGQAFKEGYRGGATPERELEAPS